MPHKFQVNYAFRMYLLQRYGPKDGAAKCWLEKFEKFCHEFTLSLIITCGTYFSVSRRTMFRQFSITRVDRFLLSKTRISSFRFCSGTQENISLMSTNLKNAENLIHSSPACIDQSINLPEQTSTRLLRCVIPKRGLTISSP